MQQKMLHVKQDLTNRTKYSNSLSAHWIILLLYHQPGSVVVKEMVETMWLNKSRDNKDKGEGKPQYFSEDEICTN